MYIYIYIHIYIYIYNNIYINICIYIILEEKNCRNYNIEIPRIFILSLLTVSPLHKDPQTI